MRFSDRELKLFKLAAGNTPLREWMRVALIYAVGQDAESSRNPDLLRQYFELLAVEFPNALEEAQRPLPLP